MRRTATAAPTPQAGAATQAPQQLPPSAGAVTNTHKEFVLRMGPTQDKWNVARFTLPVDLRHWKRPIRTYRAEEAAPEDQQSTATAAAAAGASKEVAASQTAAPGTEAAAATSSKAVKRGTRTGPMRPLYPRNVKNIPLHLEDANKEHSFIGRIVKPGGDASTMFLLVLDGNEFKVIPAGDSYQFRAKRSLSGMSLEEAEERLMQIDKQHGVSRWATAGRKSGKAEDREEGEGRHDEYGFSVFGDQPSVDSDEDREAKAVKGEKKAKDEDAVDEKEDIDFVEEWDDDDSALGIEEALEEKKERKGKMTTPGKQMKSLIKDLEGEDANFEDSDEDEDSEDGFEVGNEDEGGSEEKGTKDKSSKKRKTPTDSSPTPSSAVPAPKKIKVEPKAEPKSEEAKKSKKPRQLSAEAVRNLLIEKGRLVTLELVSYFKKDLEDPAKKGELTQILKKVAKIVEIDGKKYLVAR